MSNHFERFLAQKKEAIEALMETLQRGSEVVASAVGEFFPLCEAAAPFMKLFLDNVESNEVVYVKEQFIVVKNRLDVVSSQLEDINCEIQKGHIDSQYFSVEENVRNQFRKYQDILEARPQFQEVKTRLFLEHFENTGGERNLYVLYNAMMGNITFGESILEVVVRYESKNRRVLEDFCVRMKELFCLGLIVLLSYYALKKREDMEEDKLTEWKEKIQEVETKMKEVIEECVKSFPEQADKDVQKLVQEKDGDSLQDTAQALISFLEKKYDWVSWSVRIISHSGGSSGPFWQNRRTGDTFQCVEGQNWFYVPPRNGNNIVVSYCLNPKPIPKDTIQQFMDGPGKKGDAEAVVENLKIPLSGFMVHAVSCNKESFAAYNISEDCHYWEKHKNVALCVHSDQ